MNIINFLIYGPEMKLAPDPIIFFADTDHITPCLSSSLIDSVNRSTAVWKEFMRNSCKLALLSTGGILFAATLLKAGLIPEIGVTFLVASTVFLYITLRRSIEASRQAWLWHHWSQTPSPLIEQKTRYEIKQKQIELCLECHRFYQSLHPVPEAPFFNFFFGENPLNSYLKAYQPKALDSFYLYYERLKENFAVFQENQEESLNVLNDYRKLCESRQQFLAEKTLRLSKIYGNEEEKKIKHKIWIFINSEINRQRYELIASLDAPAIFLKETCNHIIYLTKAIDADAPHELPDIDQIPSFQPLKMSHSIYWPPIVYDENKLDEVPEEDFNAFMKVMQK